MESDLTTIDNVRVYLTHASMNLVAEPGTEFMEDEYPHLYFLTVIYIPVETEIKTRQC